MALDSKHPLYAEFLTDWTTMRDTYRGERVVKEAGERYLPPTSGMRIDGYPVVDTNGWNAYQAYVRRAVFHDFVKDAVETLIGVMHHKEAEIEVPEAMKPMLERCTIKGESAQVLLRKINEAQLTTGRIGLLLDIPENPPAGVKPTPYVATYRAEDVINWDEGRRDDQTLPALNLVVLDESEKERKPNTFEWEQVTKYRVLVLGDPAANENPNEGAVYSAAVFRSEGSGQSQAVFDASKLAAPSLMGRTLQRVPFVVCNVKDIVMEPDNPALLGLARHALAVYRTEADYRQNLFMQGQDTLVTIGWSSTGPEGETVRVGAGAHINLPSGQGNDAKYIGVESDGLSEQRECLEADKKECQAKGAQLLDSKGGDKESGEALKTRVSARAATLNQIALAGAYSLQTILRYAAEWMGLDPLEVTVKPNLDFDAAPLTGKDLVDFTTAKNQGAPIARRTLHNLLRAKNVTELTYEEEMEEIEGEEPILVGVTLPVDPNADPEDEDEPLPA